MGFGFVDSMAMAVLYRWQEANGNPEIWEDEENGVLLLFAQELFDDFKRQIEIEMDGLHEE